MLKYIAQTHGHAATLSAACLEWPCQPFWREGNECALFCRTVGRVCTSKQTIKLNSDMVDLPGAANIDLPGNQLSDIISSCRPFNNVLCAVNIQFDCYGLKQAFVLYQYINIALYSSIASITALYDTFRQAVIRRQRSFLITLWSKSGRL